MWVDVGKKTIVTALAPRPWAKAQLHFLMRKTTWKQLNREEETSSCSLLQDTNLQCTKVHGRQLH